MDYSTKVIDSKLSDLTYAIGICEGRLPEAIVEAVEERTAPFSVGRVNWIFHPVLERLQVPWADEDATIDLSHFRHQHPEIFIDKANRDRFIENVVGLATEPPTARILTTSSLTQEFTRIQLISWIKAVKNNALFVVKSLLAVPANWDDTSNDIVVSILDQQFVYSDHLMSFITDAIQRKELTHQQQRG